ncbi:MAG: monofunctional biosynthetic peptidoglycan transglycosylase [Limnohabitans sp.]|jgi:monofunctional biosynthetic peptidoglycan transglycosylase
MAFQNILRSARHPITRWILLVICAFIGLQLFFLTKIALMARIAPESTAFERSQAWQILQTKQRLPWRQTWVQYDKISDQLKRAVIASEDDIFAQHDGVQWEAIEKAWTKNAKAELQASRAAQKNPAVKVVGGSTITQQLAKNLFLAGERTFVRKGQEFVLTLMLEALLPKQRILELYLNHVEWGEGIFGAEAAAQHYFSKSAYQLSPWEAGRLAVMLPRPKHYQKFPLSEYLAGRTEIIMTRMPRAQLP